MPARCPTDTSKSKPAISWPLFIKELNLPPRILSDSHVKTQNKVRKELLIVAQLLAFSSVHEEPCRLCKSIHRVIHILVRNILRPPSTHRRTSELVTGNCFLGAYLALGY